MFRFFSQKKQRFNFDAKRFFLAFLDMLFNKFNIINLIFINKSILTIIIILNDNIKFFILILYQN